MNSHKVDPKIHGAVFLSHLFGHTAYICSTIRADVLAAYNGTSLINDAVHTNNAL